MEVILKLFADFIKLLIYTWHRCLKRLEVFVVLVFGSLVERVRSADTCHNVFTLGIDKPLAIELVVSVGRVTRECNTGSGCITHITEYHGLNVHCSTPIIRNFLDTAVCNGTLSVP
ncbi:uncharacterized protein BN459_00317 [Bacteroides sp. CAG:1060]|nr:uncharacterized protein BN459_00317 [Bacteroides sp. CAG:1060]